MNRLQLIQAIKEDYTVIFSLEGDKSIISTTAQSYFDRNKYYDTDSFIQIPNHTDYYTIVDVFVSEKNKTVFIAVKEICPCGDMYDCCDCGGVGCGCEGCRSCNACEDCLNGD